MDKTFCQGLEPDINQEQRNQGTGELEISMETSVRAVQKMKQWRLER